MTEETNIAGTVIETISSRYYDLTSSEKKIADYIVSHRSEVSSTSISELAKICGVADSTISRFSRNLGYRNYYDFKLSLAQSAVPEREEISPLSGSVNENDSFSDLCSKLYAADIDAIVQTHDLIVPEKIIEAANVLEKASKVVCMGQGGSLIIADCAANLFRTMSCKYFSVPDAHNQTITAATLSEEDAVLYFSFSGATKDMIQTLSLVRSRGAKSILITHFPGSPGAMEADIVLQCGANESPIQLGSVAAKISQLYLIDVLFSEVSRRNMAESVSIRSRIADALADKHL